MQSIGDLAKFLFSSRFQADLRLEAERAAKAMTTGEVVDKAQHLRGSTLALSLLDRKTVLLEQHRSGITEASVVASSTQAALAQIQTHIEDTAGALGLAGQVESASQLQIMSQTARNAFVDSVQHLNTQVAGRHLFSGSAVDRVPLPTGTDMLAAIETAVGGAASVNDLVTMIGTWFDNPGGSFETTAYSGSNTGYVTMPIGEEGSAIFGLRADDQVMRDTLKSLAVAVFATSPVLGFEIEEQKQALETARDGLDKVSRELTDERAALGLTEARIDRAGSIIADHLVLLATDRLDYLGINQFEEASRFEAAQQQLELLYRIAARQSRVNLSEYLR